MTISFRSATTAGYASAAVSNILTINKPAGTLDGDLLVTIVETNGPYPPATGVPSGWSLVGDATTSKTSGYPQIFFNLSVFIKVASGEPASWQWGFPFSSQINQMACLSYIGANTVVDALTTYISSNVTVSRSCPAATTTQPNEMLLRICAAQTNDAKSVPTSFNTLTGYNKRVNRGDHYHGYGDQAGVLTVQELFLPSAQYVGSTLLTLNYKAYAAVSITLSIPSGNSPPNQPSNLDPVDTWHYNLPATPTFAWQFSDPDAGDVQSAFALRRKIGAGAYEWYNVGAGTWGAVEFFNTTPNPWVLFPAAKWAAATTYLWSVSVKDNHGTQSPYSADTTVVSDTTAPTITVTLPENPYIGGFRPVVGWTMSGAGSNFWRVKIFDAATQSASIFNPNTSVALWDSGLSGASGSGLAAGFNTQTMEPSIDLPAGNYWAYVLFAGTSVQSPGWAGKAFTIAPAAAAVPSLTATAPTADTRGPRVDLVATILANLLTTDQSTIENSTLGWVPLANCTLSRSTGAAVVGEASLVATASSSATMTTCTQEGLAGIPVSVGALYKSYAQLRGVNFAAGRTCRVGVRWYDSTGALLSTTFSGTSTVTNAGFTLISTASTAAPASSVWAAVVVEVQSAVNAEAVYIDSIFFGSGSSAAWSCGGDTYGNLLSYDSASWETMTNTGQNWNNLDQNLLISRRVNGAYGGVIGTVVPHSGNCCLNMIACYQGNTSVSPIGPGSIQSPQVPVVIGAPYTGSIWIRCRQNRTFQAQLDWYDNTGTILISSTTGSPIALTANTYAQVYAQGIAPQNAGFVALRITLTNPSLDDVADLDDATITFGTTLLTDTGGGTLQSLLEIQYSEDSGTTWIADVRGAAKVLPDFTDLINSVSDFEAGVTKRRDYRGRMVDVIGLLPSAWTASVNATPASTTDWWLKDLVDPTLNMKLFIEGETSSGIDFKGSTSNAQFNVLDRPDWVVITDTYKFDNISFKSLLFAADYAKFEVLRQTNRTLLLQSDYGPEYYVVFDARERTLVNTNVEFQELSISLIQVARAPV